MSNQEDFEIEDLATEGMENIVLTQTDCPVEHQVTTTQTDCPVEHQVTTTQTECSIETQVTPTQTECSIETQVTPTQTDCPVETEPETNSESTSEDSDDYIDAMYLVSVDNQPKFVFNSKKVARKFMEIKALEIADSCISNDTSIQNIFVSEEDVNNYTISAYYKFMIVQYEVKLHSVSLSTVEKVLF